MKDEAALAIFAAPLSDSARAKCWEQGLSHPEQERARLFLDPVHRRRFVLRRWILRCLLGGKLNAAPESLIFRTNAFGKPMWSAPFDRADVFFSASHSGDMALIAIGMAGSPFGIDVEQIRPFDDADQIVARFFSPVEQQEYRTLDPADRQDAFWRVWTVKEAFIKALGVGLSFPLDHFDVAVSHDRPAAIERVQADAYPAWDVRLIAAGSNFRGALVGRNLQSLAPKVVPDVLDLSALPDPILTSSLPAT
jgi:4'-phosphopantetheinyl transferase